MASLIVEEYKIHISESSLREILSEVERAKKETEFTDEPMPDYDMEIRRYQYEKRRRGEVEVRSNYGHGSESFIVHLDASGINETDCEKEGPFVMVGEK